jgi:hypothetical protein
MEPRHGGRDQVPVLAEDSSALPCILPTSLALRGGRGFQAVRMSAGRTSACILRLASSHSSSSFNWASDLLLDLRPRITSAVLSSMAGLPQSRRSDSFCSARTASLLRSLRSSASASDVEASRYSVNSADFFHRTNVVGSIKSCLQTSRPEHPLDSSCAARRWFGMSFFCICMYLIAWGSVPGLGDSARLCYRQVITRVWFVPNGC